MEDCPSLTTLWNLVGQAFSTANSTGTSTTFKTPCLVAGNPFCFGFKHCVELPLGAGGVLQGGLITPGLMGSSRIDLGVAGDEQWASTAQLPPGNCGGGHGALIQPAEFMKGLSTKTSTCCDGARRCPPCREGDDRGENK